jgi:tagatose kinase
MYDIVTIGEILVELMTEKVDQSFLQSGTILGPFPSGAPAIAIDQAARTGARTAIMAKVGTDDFGELNVQRLKSSGVDTSHIIKTPDNITGAAFVTYFSDGSRKFIFYFAKAACGELCPADVDEGLIKDSKYLHIMGCSITGSPSMGEAVMRAVRIAKEGGVKISFDPNIRPELLKGKILDYYTEIIDACDVLLTGKSELKYIFSDVEGSIGRLLRQKDRIVVVKNGSFDTCVYTRTDAFSVPAFPATQVDATGAGDSFDGTFLALLCEGCDLRTATRFGNAAGARAVSKRGPMEGNTNRDDLEKIVVAHSSIKANPIRMPS